MPPHGNSSVASPSGTPCSVHCLHLYLYPSMELWDQHDLGVPTGGRQDCQSCSGNLAMTCIRDRRPSWAPPGWPPGSPVGLTNLRNLVSVWDITTGAPVKPGAEVHLQLERVARGVGGGGWGGHLHGPVVSGRGVVPLRSGGGRGHGGAAAARQGRLRPPLEVCPQLAGHGAGHREVRLRRRPDPIRSLGAPSPAIQLLMGRKPSGSMQCSPRKVRRSRRTELRQASKPTPATGCVGAPATMADRRLTHRPHQEATAASGTLASAKDGTRLHLSGTPDRCSMKQWGKQHRLELSSLQRSRDAA